MKKICRAILGVMANVPGWIRTGFRFVFSDAKHVIIVLLLVSVLGLFFNYHSLKHSYQNLVIDSQDTVMIYKNKTKDLYVMNQAYVTDIANLKKENADLHKEVKNLKDHPIIVTKTEIVYQVDSIKVYTASVTVNADSTLYTSNFSYNDGWCKIAGYNTFDIYTHSSETFLNTIGAQSSLYLDLIEKDKKLQFIVRADNPYLQINRIEGAVVSPEKSKILRQRFNKPWGVMIGVGPSMVVVDNSVKVYPALQLTIGYKFMSF